jgi:hypothetical protein
MAMGLTDAEAEFDRVLRHFPDCAAEVRSLARRSDRFGDMCAELGDAQRALEHIQTGSTVPHREERLAECRGWIDRLTAEMREALAENRVVRMQRRDEGISP